MPFVLRSDYTQLIKKDLLNSLIENDELNLQDAELAAQTEMESYLRGRYDLAKIFLEVLPWDEETQFAAGAVVSHTAAGAARPRVYVAQDESQGDEPGAESQAAPAEGKLPAPRKWKATDPRNAQIKVYLMDCALYLLHSRQNPNTIPQLRLDRYDHVISWLNLCRQGKISPGLPLLPAVAADGTPNTESIRPRGGSAQSKMRNSY